MRNANERWWQVVPWGWVLVSAYFTALVCVEVSQLSDEATAATFVKDYQTLLAGIATIAALLIAVQQLKRQANRDIMDANRHHQVEIDALAVLAREAEGLARAASQSSIHYRDAIRFDRSRWERLRSEVHVSLTPSISGVVAAVESHNRLLDDPDRPFLSFNHFDARQVGEARFTLRHACQSLFAVVSQRRSEVRRLIEAAS